MKLAVIPTFGASEKIPRRYVREFGGKPMIAWTIAAALERGAFDRVIVATGDEEVAETARTCGAEVPALITAKLVAQGFPPKSVMAYVLENLIDDANAFEAVCCLSPCAPFLSTDDALAGFERYQQGDCAFVFAVSSFAAPIQRALRIGSDGHVAMFQPDALHGIAKDLEEVWHDACHFYWASPEDWRNETPVIGPNSVGIVVDRNRVHSFDTPEEWQLAEIMSRANKATD